MLQGLERDLGQGWRKWVLGDTPLEGTPVLPSGILFHHSSCQDSLLPG